MVFCLRADVGRTLFGWFNLTPEEKQALLTILKKLLGENTELNKEGLRKMLEAFLRMTDPTKMDDRDRDAWRNVANKANKASQVKDLPLNQAGQRVWYVALKEDGDLDWEEGAAEPDKAQQYFLTKRGIGHLAVMEKRWAKGQQLVTWYNSFRMIANTRGPGQTVLNLQLGSVKM